MRDIAVWPCAFVPGGEPTIRVPLKEALEDAADCDAHAVGYRVPGGDLRVRWDMLPQLVEEGRLPMQEYIFVDLDTPTHDTIDPDVAAATADLVADVAEAVAGARPTTYTTRAGMRLLFRLAEPIDVRSMNPILSSLCETLDQMLRETWSECPVEVDMSSAQWTRAFRLPRAKRDGEVLASVVTHSEDLLAVDDIPEPEVRNAVAPLTDLELTDIDTVVWYHHIRPSHKVYRHRDLIARGEPLPFAQGKWHKGLVAVVGSLCGALAGALPSPEELAGAVVSILAPSVIAGADDCTNDLVQLRDLALRFAPNSWRAPENEAEEVVEEEEQVGNIIVAHPTASVYWVREDGTWRGPLSAGSAASRLAESYPDLDFATKSHTPYPGAKLVYLYGTSVDEVRFSAHRETLEDRRLTVKLYGKRPTIAPKRNPEVDEWLDHVEAGGAPVREWLSWLGDLSTPIPAMLWHGKAGAGKGLMASAIGAFFGGGFTDWRRLGNDQFASSGWLDSPFVWGDEFGGFSDERQSEVFRELVGNVEHTVRQMRVSPMKIETALRIFLTTNEDHALAIRGKASQESLRAVRNRMVAVAVPVSAADYLEAKGGRGGLTKHWVTGPNGEPGALVQHIAYLQTQRPAAFVGRYPVDAWADTLLLRGAILGNEDEAVVWLAAATSVLANQKGCVIRGKGEVLVNPRTLAAGWAQLRLGAHPKTATEITQVVKRFSLGQVRVDGVRYHRIDGDILLATLEDTGHDGADRLAESLSTGNVIPVQRRQGEQHIRSGLQRR